MGKEENGMKLKTRKGQGRAAQRMGKEENGMKVKTGKEHGRAGRLAQFKFDFYFGHVF